MPKHLPARALRGRPAEGAGQLLLLRRAKHGPRRIAPPLVAEGRQRSRGILRAGKAIHIGGSLRAVNRVSGRNRVARSPIW